jgi:hypothetical protein
LPTSSSAIALECVKSFAVAGVFTSASSLLTWYENELAGSVAVTLHSVPPFAPSIAV